jgi:hypothetical protein
MEEIIPMERFRGVHIFRGNFAKMNVLGYTISIIVIIT